ncbi:unnamed protein product [Darwinula stevensoni]|uniref:AIG1-type G domain-containing protein n=1 Tax=Darwinula stevensoni TaxID=69355 RepID=A0A7R9A1A2_9CRUS|nr:unnamed protein product [Darwinula stevensoni]CAG0883046.1 unnamed protein product [Darwinula stevensoni]
MAKTEKESLHEELKRRSKAIQKENSTFYCLPFHSYTDRHLLGENKQDEECMNILFLGLTGSGKSMMVEVMGNYGLGVDFEDHYRFQLKEDGPTTRITSHTFFTRNFGRFRRPVTLIDTPGFQKGTPQQDQELTKDIQEYIKLNHPEGIHAIAYIIPGSQLISFWSGGDSAVFLKEVGDLLDFLLVMKEKLVAHYVAHLQGPSSPPGRALTTSGSSSQLYNGKLTAEQKMVMGNMADVLGEKAHKISYLFCTFADSKSLPVLGSVSEAGLRYKKHFAINSSSYFAEEEEETHSTDEDEEITKKGKIVCINELLWKMTTDSIREFLEDIQNNAPILIIVPRERYTLGPLLEDMPYFLEMDFEKIGSEVTCAAFEGVMCHLLRCCRPLKAPFEIAYRCCIRTSCLFQRLPLVWYLLWPFGIVYRYCIRVPFLFMGRTFMRESMKGDTEKERLHEKLKDGGTIVQGEDFPTYLLPFKHITEQQHHFGEEQLGEECVNILLLGKSMLLEVVGNYGLGVDFQDPYRFRIKEEPTEKITSHTFYTRDIRRFPRPITLIDTPGFQKTTPEMDRKLVEDIRAFIHQKYLLGVHAVVYVIPGSQGRLTAEQKTLMRNMAKVFGDEAQKITYLFCTFADSKRLPVLQSVKEAGLRYKKHFPINSSSYFAKEEEEEEMDGYCVLPWKLGFMIFLVAVDLIDEIVEVQEVSALERRLCLEEDGHMQGRNEFKGRAYITKRWNKVPERRWKTQDIGRNERDSFRLFLRLVPLLYVMAYDFLFDYCLRASPTDSVPSALCTLAMCHAANGQPYSRQAETSQLRVERCDELVQPITRRAAVDRRGEAGRRGGVPHSRLRPQSKTSASKSGEASKSRRYPEDREKKKDGDRKEKEMVLEKGRMEEEKGKKEVEKGRKEEKKEEEKGTVGESKKNEKMRQETNPYTSYTASFYSEDDFIVHIFRQDESPKEIWKRPVHRLGDLESPEITKRWHKVTEKRWKTGDIGKKERDTSSLFLRLFPLLYFVAYGFLFDSCLRASPTDSMLYAFCSLCHVSCD